MSKIVFFCIPAHGHTNPTLGVVRELVAQGHQVWYYSYNNLKEKIEQTGAVFLSCDVYDRQQNLTPQDGARIARDLAFATQVLADTTLALDEPVRCQLQEIRPDCIVGDSMAVWAKGLARKLNIPFVSSTTTFAFNQYSARVIQQSSGGLLKMLLSLPKINRQLKRLQQQGYPFKNILDIIQNDNNTDTIVYTSPEFQPCADTFSARYSFVGPIIRPAAQPFAKQKPVLVYLSMGTVNNDMLPLYRSCVEAFAGTDLQLILSVGDQVDPAAFGQLPENIAVYPSVDQIAVLEQADVFVSHCGMNSVSESLYFGVPLVLLPQTDEQRGVANRTEQLEAGLRPGQVTGQGILEAVNTLLADPHYKANAEKIGQGFRRCSGAKGAAEKILSVCKQ